MSCDDLNYEVYGPDKNNPDGPLVFYHLTHRQMSSVIKDKRINDQISYFYRFIKKSDTEGVPIDTQPCYLGEIFFIDQIKSDNIDLYIELQNKVGDEELKNSLGYVIALKNGDAYVPDRKVKVFNENLELIFGKDIDNNEDLIQEFIVCSQQMKLADEKLLTEEGEQALKDVKAFISIYKDYPLN